jgi:Glutamine synthetase, catalytic domain
MSVLARNGRCRLSGRVGLLEDMSVQEWERVVAVDLRGTFPCTRGVAHRHGLYASFAATPFPDEIGSGAHVHVSLWDAGGRRSLLDDPVPAGRPVAAGPALRRGRDRAPARCYLAVRGSQEAASSAHDLDVEVRHHLYRF